MQTLFTLVFLGFIVGSLCDVVATLIHPPRPAVRPRSRGLRKRTEMKRSRKIAERQRWDVPIAM